MIYIYLFFLNYLVGCLSGLAGFILIWRMILSLGIFWIQILGLIGFLLGFFPLKTPLKGDAPSIREEQEQELQSLSYAWRRRVGQVVIVVIDALRVDFVFDDQFLAKLGVSVVKKRSKIEYLNDWLYKSKNKSSFGVLGLVAEVAPPTVTLPRIKAITTGSVPGYVDIIMNFESSSLNEDSIVRQWRRLSRNIVFYGDETWQKLYPEDFLRSEGTSSFFVSDYTEVDVNVTRHLSKEISKEDWDIMILHYLGLDHIGHVYGPGSSLIPHKLKEMGDAIEQIISGLENKPWKENLPPLILVLGDHGMADVGGHGGSTPFEVFTPVVALSPLFKSSPRGRNMRETPIKQSDLAPTLSWLTGVSIPRNNMGALVDSVVLRIERDPNFQRLSSLYNLKQVSRVYSRNVINSDLESVHKDFFGKESPRRNASMEQILGAVEYIRNTLFDSILEYNYVFMGIGALTLFSSFMTLGYLKVKSLRDYSHFVIWSHVLRVLSLSSSSFIEEEHQIAYLLSMTALLVFLITTDSSLYIFFVMLCYRGARTLNQTGNKWAHLSDVSDWLLEDRNRITFIFVFSIVSLWAVGVRYNKYHKARCLLSAALYVAVLCCKIAESSIGVGWPVKHLFSHRGINEARFVYGLAVLIVLYEIIMVFRSKVKKHENSRNIYDSLLDGFLPVMVLLNRPENSCVILLSCISEHIIWTCAEKASLEDSMMVTIYYLFGLTSFFHQGNCTSSLAKIDVGAGYIGVTTFNPATVGLILLISTYSGPILWLFFLFKRLKGRTEVILTTLIVMLGSEAVFYSIIVTIQRFHLFVWTVFSPKLLYVSVNHLVHAFMASLFCILNKYLY